MRVLLAGLILLFATSSAFAQAEAEGYVESIGYGGRYRPNCWTPMKLHMQSRIADTRTYKIAIVQEDLDRDRVLYTRPFTLNGNAGGAGKAEDVWVYFVPQPRDLRISGGAAEFTNLIRIFLCKEDGKQLLQIPFQQGMSLPKDLDQKMTLYGGKQHGTRLVLQVGGSESKPIDGYEKPEGLVEDLETYKLTPSELPGDVKGFAAVDAIVWLGSDPDMRADSLAAIQDYVRDGGKLVVCQGKNWQKFKESELAALLPVTLEGVQKEKGAASLRMLAGMPMFEALDDDGIAKLRPPWGYKNDTTNKVEAKDPWYSLVGKEMEIVRASVKPGAFVNLYCQSDPTMPYLARWNYGLGTVVWVAQDFGDQPEVQAKGQARGVGWQAIWDRTFDWRNDTIVSMMPQPPLIYKNFTSNLPDLGRTILTGMELPRRGAALVALAMVLFIGYWLVAGPGSYFFLLARRRAYYSWVAFAACALAATALTAAVVKLVLRGPPQLQHVTFVHMAPDHETVAHSQFGLYIPRDGKQHIELTDIAPKRFSYVIPYPIHPDHLADSAEFPAYKEFEIPMRDRNSAEPPAIDVPYRSTLKKFAARWVGQSPGGIDGKANWSGTTLSGVLVNNTGHDLKSVYLVFTRTAELPALNPDDEMIELSDPLDGRASWASGSSLDLGDMWGKLGLKGTERKPGNVGWRGPLNRLWMESWSDKFTSSMVPGGGFDDRDRAALLMTIFDRLRVGKIQDTNGRVDRYELLRPGGRQFDASGAVSAGQLLIFAKAEDVALPFGLKVEGEQVKGEGVVYYQVIVPLARSADAAMPMTAESSIFDLANAPAVEPSFQDRPQQPRSGGRSVRPPQRR